MRAINKPLRMITGIYKIVSPTKSVYIGQTWNFHKRVMSYKNLFCKDQVKLYNSFLKHGVNNHIFELVCELPIDVSQKIMDEYERFYWQQYVDCQFTMLNLKEPGLGGKHSEETKLKMKGRVPWNRGKQHSEKTRKKISEAKTGKKTGLTWNKGKKMTFSEEHRKNLSKAVTGIKKSEEWRENLSKSHKGKKQTSEHIAKRVASIKANKLIYDNHVKT